jgi:hypothetical protein
MKRAILALFAAALASAQTTTAPTAATPATPAVDASSLPSYSTSTGVRYSYYDRVLTETTNLSVHVTGAQTTDTPAGLWAVASSDATPRTQSSSAAFRAGARYFLHPVAKGLVIAYANLAAGATTTTTAAISAASTATVSSSLLGNLDGGLGFIWRACKTFNPSSKVNCILDLDYELNAVSSQAVKPIIGLYVGVTF